MLSPVIKIDSRPFNRALREYMRYSKRELAEVINQKGFSIAQSAVYFTHRANKADIRAALRETITATRHKGRQKGTFGTGPRAAILVNWNRGRKGLRGLHGAEMAEEETLKIQRRADGRNFLRAGWLPSVVIFGRAIHPKREPRDNAKEFISRFGSHGSAVVAKSGINPKARFWNMAFTRHTSTEAGYRYAEEGLVKAISQEIRRMAEHVAKKLQVLSR